MMSFPIISRFRLVVFGFLAATVTSVCLGQEPVLGDYWAHDPSTIVKDGSRYYIFTTGQGIPNKYSTDLRNWTNGAPVYPGNTPPAWAASAVPGYDPNNWNWAPDIAYFNGKYHLYYSVSAWGSIDSVIGLFTSPSLISPSWSDEGKVVQSDAIWEAGPDTDTTSHNCIDPSILAASDSTIWMVYGSYSDGILVTQIDPLTGKRLNPASPGTKIADNGPVFFSNTTEGAHIHQRGSYYYLFLNFGGCCSGVDSTYNIRVGRSTSVTGPYLDRDGVNMLNGGGTLLLGTYINYIGPGHAGVFTEGGTDWLTYHYYDGNDNGWAKLGLRKLQWTADDWPYLSKPGTAATAFYTSDVDARDHMDVRNGQLMNGAATGSDPDRGGILTLDGANDYVHLPNSVANGNTFAAWVKWNGGDDWQRIFDFGDGTNRYHFLTPRAPNGKMRYAITFTGPGGENQIDAPTALPSNSWCHVAVSVEPGRGTLYLNGRPLATNNSMTQLPSQFLVRSNNIGRSQWGPDAYFSGQIDSFRVFDHALTSDEIRDVANAHPALAHRYSFTQDVTDSIGEAHGELKGNAVITNGALKLTGAVGGYAELPGGLVSGCSAATFEFWATFGANANWTRVFDFGTTNGIFGSQYAFFCPRTQFGTQRFEISTGAGIFTCDRAPMLDNRSVHVVCILDPSNSYAAIYTNGVLETQTNATIPVLTGVNKTIGYLGRSLFANDGWLNGTIDEFRIYDGRLTPEEITANFIAGPDALALPITLQQSLAGNSTVLTWPSYAAGFDLEAADQLSIGAWSPVVGSPLISNNTFRMSLPATNTMRVFRVRR